RAAPRRPTFSARRREAWDAAASKSEAVTTVTPRNRRVAAAVVGAALAVTVAGPVNATAGDDFVAGSGAAVASAIQEGPTASGLSLKLTFGESLAGYISTAAQ